MQWRTRTELLCVTVDSIAAGPWMMKQSYLKLRIPGKSKTFLRTLNSLSNSEAGIANVVDFLV